MSKNKLQRFAELKNFPNVLQPAKPKFINWQKHFGNNNDIILELACGHGGYTLGLAKMYPNKNFIGIDIKGARIWKGAKFALEQKLTNVAFLRTQIQWLDNFFILPKDDSKSLPLTKGEDRRGSRSVSEIWITFPDPFPKKRHAKNRLTSPRFLDIYKKILKPASATNGSGGIIHLKTDNINLFNYSVETAIAENWKIKQIINNIYSLKTLPPELQIQTFYEKQHLKNARQIHYLQIARESNSL